VGIAADTPRRVVAQAARAGGAVFRVGWTVVILMALCYPAVTLPNKWNARQTLSELT
jgi:hypothetical protein